MSVHLLLDDLDNFVEFIIIPHHHRFLGGILSIKFMIFLTSCDL